MNRLRAANSAAWGLVSVVIVGSLAGCTTSSIELLSYKDPYFPQRFRATFAQSTYRIAPDGDIHITTCTRPDIANPDDDGIVQYLHVQVYWKPAPGKTPAESTMSDALVRYVVATRTGVAVYTGTGFVFPKRKRGHRLHAEIELVRLHLDSQSGDLPDMLGDARLTGELGAREDPVSTTQIIRTMEQLAAR